MAKEKSVRVATGNPCITDAQADELVEQCRKLKQMLLLSKRVAEEVKEILATHKFLEDFPAADRKSLLSKASSALNPNPESPLISVGMFGSVWIDGSMNGTSYRLALNPNGTTVETAGHIEIGGELYSLCTGE